MTAWSQRRAEARAEARAEHEQKVVEMRARMLALLDDDDEAEEADEDSPEEDEMGMVTASVDVREAIPSSSALTHPEAEAVVERHVPTETRLQEMIQANSVAVVQEEARRPRAAPPVRAPIIEPLEVRGPGPGQPESEYSTQVGIPGLAADKASVYERHFEEQHAIRRSWEYKRMSLKSDLRYCDQALDALKFEIRGGDKVEPPWRAPIYDSVESIPFGHHHEDSSASWANRGGGQRRRQAKAITLKRQREHVLEQLRDLGPCPKFEYVPKPGATTTWDGGEPREGDVLATVNA